MLVVFEDVAESLNAGAVSGEIKYVYCLPYTLGYKGRLFNSGRPIFPCPGKPY
jgi:hypothetical protein